MTLVPGNLVEILSGRDFPVIKAFHETLSDSRDTALFIVTSIPAPFGEGNIPQQTQHTTTTRCSRASPLVDTDRACQINCPLRGDAGHRAHEEEAVKGPVPEAVEGEVSVSATGDTLLGATLGMGTGMGTNANEGTGAAFGWA